MLNINGLEVPEQTKEQEEIIDEITKKLINLYVYEVNHNLPSFDNNLFLITFGVSKILSQFVAITINGTKKNIEEAMPSTAAAILCDSMKCSVIGSLISGLDIDEEFLKTILKIHNEVNTKRPRGDLH